MSARELLQLVQLCFIELRKTWSWDIKWLFWQKFIVIRFFPDPVRVSLIGRNPIQVLLIRSDPVQVLSIRSDPVRSRFCKHPVNDVFGVSANSSYEDWLTSLPTCAFTAMLEHCTGIAELTGSNHVETLIFFQASSFQLLELENLLRWSSFTFIYNRSTNMNYFIYTTCTRH